MKIIGSQRREMLEETSYRLEELMDGDAIAILVDRETGKREYWHRSDDYAGYVIEINGVGYEFVSSSLIPGKGR